jgi:hypothetical protein
MKDNAFECEYKNLYDLKVNTGASHLEIWFEWRNVGLDASFSRISLDKLDKILREDRTQAEKTNKVDEDEWKRAVQRLESIENPNERIRDDIESMKRLKNQHPLIKNMQRLPSDGDSSGQEVDSVGDRVRKVAVSDCLDADGLIPFLNFQRLEIHHSGRKFVIRDGVQTEDLGIAYCYYPQGLRLGFSGNAITVS